MTRQTREMKRGGDIANTLRWPQSAEGLTADAVDFVALSHVLANTCRWGGRTVNYYSLAQHAVLASRAVESLAGSQNRRRLALLALLAEARTAWLGDTGAGGAVSARAMERIRRDGGAIDRAVREAAGLDGGPTDGEAELLRFATHMLEAALRRDFPNTDFGQNPAAAFPPMRGRIRPLQPGRAALAWRKRFRELTVPSPKDGEPGTGGPGQPELHPVNPAANQEEPEDEHAPPAA